MCILLLRDDWRPLPLNKLHVRNLPLNAQIILLNLSQQPIKSDHPTDHSLNVLKAQDQRKASGYRASYHRKILPFLFEPSIERVNPRYSSLYIIKRGDRFPSSRLVFLRTAIPSGSTGHCILASSSRVLSDSICLTRESATWASRSLSCDVALIVRSSDSVNDNGSIGISG